MTYSSSRSDYACEPEVLGEGGFAKTFRATFKPDGTTVVFKRLLLRKDDAARARMKREIEVMRELEGHPHLMPVLASDPAHGWYVMPEADGSLFKLRADVDTDAGRLGLVLQVAQGLAAAHEAGFVHRDVTPGNILRMPSGAWVLADFGLVRRPPGMTTNQLTGTGSNFGTWGYVAPELLADPHTEASPASDVFSLARVLRWLTTGREQIAGDLTVEPGPFRRAIRDATQRSPGDRASLAQFVSALETALNPFPLPQQSRQDLVALASAGDVQAARKLFEIAIENASDGDFYLDALAEISSTAITPIVVTLDDDEVLTVAGKMAYHWNHSFNGRNFDYYNHLLRWMQNLAQGAAEAKRWGLLEDLAELFVAEDAGLDRWSQFPRSVAWLRSLQGEAAVIVARVLMRDPKAAQYYGRDWDPSQECSVEINVVLTD